MGAMPQAGIPLSATPPVAPQPAGTLPTVSGITTHQ